jgi:hypothetical protein
MKDKDVSKGIHLRTKVILMSLKNQFLTMNLELIK